LPDQRGCLRNPIYRRARVRQFAAPIRSSHKAAIGFCTSYLTRPTPPARPKPAPILLTFLLLVSAFGSVWDATIILVNMPVALLGGLVGLGVTLSVSAAVGFIALLGQAVLNGVLVVSAIRARLDRGENLWTATIEGARERLRAILMTAMLASLGLLPAAMSHAIGSETQRPIAVVVVGGTISSALLTLVVLPVSYYWAGAARAWFRRRRAAATGA
jgi:cobalt-zinc-cadmium resistance protein CzcA